MTVKISTATVLLDVLRKSEEETTTQAAHYTSSGSGAIGGQVYGALYLTVGEGLRVSSSNALVRLEERPDEENHVDHSFSEDRIDVGVNFTQSGGWQKYYDPAGARELGWWDAPEAPSAATSSAGVVRYRYLLGWNTTIATPGTYWSGTQSVTGKLLGHNGAHQISLRTVDGNGAAQVAFTSSAGGSSLAPKPEDKEATVGNLILTEVSTSNGTSDYFKFDPASDPDSPLKNPTVNFTIQDAGGLPGHIYLWRVQVRSTDIEDQSTGVIYQGLSPAGPVVVPINREALAPDSPAQSVTDWGTYNFNVSVREYETQDKAQDDLNQSIAQGRFIDSNKIDMTTLRSALLYIPYTMPAPNEARKGHDGKLIDNPDQTSDLQLSYFLRDATRSNDTSAQSKSLTIELVPPTLDDAILTETNWSRLLNTPVLDRQYKHFDEGELVQDATYISVVSADDDHAAEYRDHKPAAMLAKNKRWRFNESSRYDLEIWYDGLNPVSLTPGQKAAIQTYIAGVFDQITLDFVDDTGTAGLNQRQGYSDGIQAHFHGVTDGIPHDYRFGISAKELSGAQQNTQTPVYQTVILNEPPSTQSQVLSQGHVAATLPYGTTFNTLANGHERRPFLCALLFKTEVIGDMPEQLSDADKQRSGYRDPIPGNVPFGVRLVSVPLQVYANVVLHELLHASLAERSNGSHCATSAATCIRNSAINKWYNSDMSRLNVVTTFDSDGSGDSHPTRSPFHDPAEIYAVLRNMKHGYRSAPPSGFPGFGSGWGAP